MESLEILERLNARTQDSWLVGQDSQAFFDLTKTLIQEFAAAHEATGSQSILISERNPTRFLAGFLAAQATTQRVFLGNSDWGTLEWQQALAVAQPDRLWGDRADVLQLASSNSSAAAPLKSPPVPPEQLSPTLATQRLILIPTGGTSGLVRFVAHRWETLAAAVVGLQQYVQSAPINSICALPLYHVSGLMQCMRSFLSGGALWLVPFKHLKTGSPYLSYPSDWFISLVPTQLQALLEIPPMAHWLTQCKTVFLGGAPSWPDLLSRARSQGVPLALCYGMTETAAQIATLKPEDFWAGKQTVGQVLPHAQVTIVDGQGQPVAPGTPGQIQISAESLALGYYPAEVFVAKVGKGKGKLWARSRPQFAPDDIGYLDEHGHLTLVGRLSHKIISGGENVFPAEVEAAIWATELVRDVAVLGRPDPYWGQCVVAVYVPRHPTPSVTTLDVALQGTLARFKRPKAWVPVEALPRNAQGKLNRQTLQHLVNQKNPE